jgi:hypothetical protein
VFPCNNERRLKQEGKLYKEEIEWERKEEET